MSQRITTPSSNTPRTDGVFDSLTKLERDLISKIDNRRLAIEKEQKSPEIAAKMTHPVHSVGSMLREWELLVRAVSSGWASHQVTIDDYLFALDVRANIEDRVVATSLNMPPSIVRLVHELDQLFLSHTTTDPEKVERIDPWLRPVRDRLPDWLWDRAPVLLPW
ncbi:hypothetical protein JJV70_06010 [Streptomyces sp. JJ66]|uniref:hypothetical protein n=1 Tax=Streptomyces sp. JJ66 TaxID=2803843 RepID=UPI001C5A027B|nr:hypothetical protein [Streptomyces sp. JJ66]MBW1601672.1 hypothetical protein [Streptomyces sp. JJ66]